MKLNGECANWTQMLPLLEYNVIKGQNFSTEKVLLEAGFMNFNHYFGG